MPTEQKIRVKAMCLLTQDGFVLVADGASMQSNVRPISPGNFYRVLGGSINFNETAEEAVRREIREEAQTEVENLQLVKVIENRYQGGLSRNHDIVFLFKGEPKEKNLDKSKINHIIEDTYEFNTVWVSIEDLLEGTKLLKPDIDYKEFLKM